MIRTALLAVLSISLLSASTTGGDERTTASIFANPLPDKGLVDVYIQFTNAEGWHLYWQNPGDSGLTPKVTWTLPEGWEAEGSLMFPAPERKEIYGIVTFELGGTFTIRQRFKAPAGSQGTLGAKLSWLACAEACIPGKANLSLPVAVSTPAESAVIEQVAAIEQRFPTPATEQAVTISSSDGWLELSVSEGKAAAFFPGDKGIPLALDIPQEIGTNGQLRIKIKDGAEAPELLTGVVTLKGETTPLAINHSITR